MKSKKGKVLFKVDEHPRDVKMEELNALKPVFVKDGLVTAGNASVRRMYCKKKISALCSDGSFVKFFNMLKWKITKRICVLLRASFYSKTVGSR